MKNKIFVITILILMWGIEKAFGQEQSLTTKITDVTVYRSMARETRSTKVNLKPGYNEITITRLASEMIEPSLQVALKGEAELLTATPVNSFYIDPAYNNYDSEQTTITDSIKTVDVELKWLSEQRSVATGEVTLISELMKPIAGKESLAAAEINSMADVYRNRIMELKHQLFTLTLKEDAINKRKKNFQQKLSELGQKIQVPIKEVVLAFEATKSEELEIDIMYLINSASWTPCYDISVSNTSEPVNLNYKAKIVQHTANDWKDVKVSLSTVNPGTDNNRPLMQPRYVDYHTYRFTPSSGGVVSNMMQAEIFVPDMTPEPTILPSEIDEQLEFNIAKRQSIKAGGKEHICSIEKITIPATYKYHVVPKLDPTAFLLAKITDYGKYNLLTGMANIYYSDTYVGQVQVTPTTVSDTLLVSLGRDERIVVKRNRILNKTSKKQLEKDVRDEYEWEIKVRNNKSSTIEIEVLDQIPLSRRKDEITVKTLDTGKAEYMPEYGKLLWNLRVPANTTETIGFSYYIQYPKGKNVEES